MGSSREIGITLKTVTPTFLGGAEVGDPPELRPPSLKGALRFWYRAIDPKFEEREPKLFGSTRVDQGQSLLRLGLEKALRSGKGGGWDFKRYRERGFETRGNDGLRLNGIVYLGFPFGLKGEAQQRRPIPPGSSLSIVGRFGNEPDELTRKAVLAAWWLLGHLGGLGSRSRRGFGTVALQKWDCDWGEAEALPIAHGARTANEWLPAFEKGCKVLQDWFGIWSGMPSHTVLGRGARVLLYPKDFEGPSESCQPWEKALWRVGTDLQGFRQKASPDYKNVRAHLEGNGTLKNGEPLRTAFGMPLRFQYQRGRLSTTFVPAGYDRSASPLFLRVVEFGDDARPLVVRLCAPPAGGAPGIKEEGRNEVWKAPDGRVVDSFLQMLRTRYGDSMQEVQL